MDRRKFLKASTALAAGYAATPDHLLGMDQQITREDHTSPQTMAAADWDGYSGIGDYKGSNGNTHSVMTAGHGIRDGLYNMSFRDDDVIEETYDCVIVGGGISGLAAAQTFVERNKQG